MTHPTGGQASFRRRVRPSASWCALAVLVAVYFIVGLLGPDHELAQFSGDNGVKLIQIDNLIRGHAWLDYSGAAIDPDGRLFPLRPPFIVAHAGRPYSVYLNPVTYLAAPAYRWFGIQGCRLLVLFCAVGMVAATVWLARAAGLENGRSWLAAALTLIATPLWFYGWVFWEHLPAALLCVIATAAVLHASRTTSAGRASFRWSFFAASSLGVAMACRPEALLYALALALAMAWVERRPAIAAVLVVGTPIAYALTSLSLPGMPFVENASLILDKVFGWLTDPTSRGPWLEERLSIVRMLLIGVLVPIEASVPTTARHLALALVVILFALVSMGRFGVRPPAIVSSGILAVAGLLLVLPALSLAADSQVLLSGLLICCPLVIVAMPCPAVGRDGASDAVRGNQRRSLVLGVTAVGFLLAAMLLAQNDGGQQWGPRYLLPAMPLIACLVASRPELTPRWGSAGQRLRSLTLVGLLFGSIAIQALGMRSHLITRQRETAAWERVAALDGEVVLTPAWFIPQEGAGLALRDGLPFLLAQSREEMAYALDALAHAGAPTFTFIEMAGRISGLRRFGRYMETESIEFYLHPFSIRASRFELSR